MSKGQFDDITAFQRAWFEAWANGTRTMIEMWRRTLEMQQQLVHTTAEQHKRWHVEIPDGPALTDKYGKRAHDIDPERDI